jgi:hypothetical protein
MRRNNVVDLLTRYPVRYGSDPVENRLTAALVAALHQANGLRAALVESVWETSYFAGERPAIGTSWDVTSQKPIGLGRHAVDIELLAVDGTARVWIEAKVKSELSGDEQLDDYARALAGKPERHKLLVLLAPASRRTALEPHLTHRAKVPDLAVAFASWSQAHRVLSSWRPVGGSERNGRWLVKEVADYMAGQGHGSVNKLRQVDYKAPSATYHGDGGGAVPLR